MSVSNARLADSVNPFGPPLAGRDSVANGVSRWTDYRTGAMYGIANAYPIPAGIAAQRAAVADAAAAAGRYALSVLRAAAADEAYSHIEAFAINARIGSRATEEEAYAAHFEWRKVEGEMWSAAVTRIANQGLYRAQTANLYGHAGEQFALTLPESGTDRYLMVRAAMGHYVINQSGLQTGLVRRLVNRLNALPVPTDNPAYFEAMDMIAELVGEENRDDSICWDGSTKFLDHFSLRNDLQNACENGTCDESDCDECRPEVTTTVTLMVRVTVDITTRDEDRDIESDATDNLSLDIEDRYGSSDIGNVNWEVVETSLD